MIIEIDGISIEVSKKPIKHMNLKIYPPEGLVKVSAPLSFSDRLIKQHLQEKSKWIQMQREQMRKRSAYQEEILETGATIAFKGTNYLLVIKEHHGPSAVRLDGELLFLYSQPQTTPTQKQMVLDKWYRKEMEALIPKLLNHWEAIIQVQTAEWGIKKMKTRWGSCNTRARRIWLNLNLIKKPLVCLEYVLVHELVHLHEASHNSRFYRLMTQFMPEWRQYQYMLEGTISRK
ncbi:M48 family metallopeptidase [Legionella worsleiensis]|uniref:Zinc metalloprotease n=1 Tax=Legionella worsleiensis TaxID=45076 RepID=A0A0W1AJZ3_9GAMM|nr:SprT family zinc-dependent metalloprotease [Legionella worsleiensis]KTD81674.1 zinc metalloprotease [Legionella worsleiensis]STY31916.1 metal-dependent hydrolase [Legionella worsleiensis]